MFTIMNYSVFNPNFVSDVIKFLQLNASPQQVMDQITVINNATPLTAAQAEAGKLTLKEKLNAFIDRIEFIGHLDLVSRNAQQQRFRLMGQEVHGLDWDIDSLRLYLSLTCVSIFADMRTETDYFGQILENTSPELQARISSNATILNPTAQIPDSLRGKGLFLYNIRNSYTHSGKRFHFLVAGATQIQNFPAGDMQHKRTITLSLAPEFNLINYTLNVVKHDVKRRFGWI